MNEAEVGIARSNDKISVSLAAFQADVGKGENIVGRRRQQVTLRMS